MRLDSDISLEVLWYGLHARLGQFIRSRLRDEADAEDILQDVFLRIHERLDTVRDMERLESWIYQIARNCIADYYRRQSRFTALGEEEEEVSSGDSSKADAPGDAASEEDLVNNLTADIREIVQSLPEPYREALVLTEYEGMPQKELAERLGISLSGAKSRVQRARQKVKDTLMACCHFEFDARGLVYDYHQHCCRCCEETSPIC